MSAAVGGNGARRLEPMDSLDDFPTPPWAGRALCEHLRASLALPLQRSVVLEPAANRGNLVRAFEGEWAAVLASDVADYGAGFAVRNFLTDAPLGRADWVVTNPPFNLAEDFIARGLEVARDGVAMLLPVTFLAGMKRGTGLFRSCPPSDVLVLSERPVMFRGRAPDPDVKEWRVHKGVRKLVKPSTNKDCAWFIWWKCALGKGLTRVAWSGACRERLTRPGDYPQDIAQKEVLHG